MALAGDFFRTRYLVELDGVQTVTKQDWKLTTVNGADPLNTVLLAIATAWQTTLTAVLNTGAVLTCCDFKNWTRNEQALVYPALAGTGVGDSHPQFTVLRTNTYAKDELDVTAPVRRGATNISGIIESLSTRGRLNNMAALENFRQFQFFPWLGGPTSWDIQPYLRYETAPASGIYAFDRMEWAQIGPTFRTLRSRKTGACTI